MIRISMPPSLHPSTNVTILTLMSFFLALAAVHFSLYWLLVLPIALPFTVRQFDHLTTKELAKCTITMVIFGVLGACSLEVGAVQAFIWLNIIRYYG